MAFLRSAFRGDVSQAGMMPKDVVELYNMVTWQMESNFPVELMHFVFPMTDPWDELVVYFIT